jgi:hypothetical protein
MATHVLQRGVVVLALAGGLAATDCRRQAPGEAPEASAARAQAALAPFKASLRDALTSSLAEGPEKAAAVCADLAPKLAERASVGGVRVGRAAERRRNPENTPPAWAAASMSELARAPSAGAHRVVPLEGGRVGYVETILTAPVCLTCHGEALAPSVAAVISARYPNDRAVGFRVGDMRGAFWVELPPPDGR